MDKQAKTRRRSPLGWALSFAGSRKGSYVGSVLLALLSVLHHDDHFCLYGL